MKKPKTNREGLDLVLAKVSVIKIAAHLTAKDKKITRQGVDKWKRNANVGVPIQYVDDIAELTGLTREQILPEVYGPK